MFINVLLCLTDTSLFIYICVKHFGLVNIKITFKKLFTFLTTEIALFQSIITIQWSGTTPQLDNTEIPLFLDLPIGFQDTAFFQKNGMDFEITHNKFLCSGGPMKNVSTAMWFMSGLIHSNIWVIVKCEYIVY